MFLGQMPTQSDIFGLNFVSMILLGPAKALDTTLIFLGIKCRNTDIFGFNFNALLIDLIG